MQILFFKRDADASLLKSTVLREITVPAYTRSDGVFVPEHRKHVHVNLDVAHTEVLAGRGSATQRHAHARLTQVNGFNALPEGHRLAHIQSAATNEQGRRGHARDMSGWRASAAAGRNPTPGQWNAFYRLDNDARARTLTAATVAAVDNDISFLRAPPREIATAEAASRFSVGVAAHAARSAAEAAVAAPDAAEVVPDSVEAQEFDGEVEVNGVRLSRRENGSWISRSGIVQSVGSAMWIAANVESGIGMNQRQVDASTDRAKLLAAEVLVRAGHLPQNVLNLLFKPSNIASTGAREGDTLEIVGNTYVLRRGGWNLRGEDATPTPVPAATVDSADQSQEVDFNGYVVRRTATGNWIGANELQSGLGSPIWLAANIMSGIGVTKVEANAATERSRLQAAEFCVSAGRDPVEILNTLFPISGRSIPRRSEGDRRVFKAKTYVVRDGGWNLVEDAAATPAAAPPPVADALDGNLYGVTIDGMSLSRDADGKWVSDAGVVHGEGSAIWLAANVASGVGLTPAQVAASTDVAKNRAIEVLIPTGRFADVLLNLFYPDSTDPASGRREGETKIVNGSTYVLRGGRWHLIADIEAPENIYHLNNDDTPYRRRGQGLWQYNQTNDGRFPWHNVVNSAIVTMLERRYRNQTTAPTVAANPSILITRPVASTATGGSSAVQSAMMTAAMSMVQLPREIDTWSNSETNECCRRRIGELRVLAQAGNYDAITNFATSTTRPNYRVVDRYRNSLLTAAGQARTDLRISEAQAAAVPAPPEITGSNPDNPALLVAQRRVRALFVAAQSATDPIAAVQRITTNRGNTYQNRANDYKQRLISFLSQMRPSIAPAPSAAPAVAPAPAAATRRATTALAAPAAATMVEVERDPIVAANPQGKTVAQLGFVPRPNVPLVWTVRREGVIHPTMGLIPWPDDRMKELAEKYLTQDGNKQNDARLYQLGIVSHVSPQHPGFNNLQARAAEIAASVAAAAAAAAAVQAVADATARRAAMERTRRGTTKFVDALAALPDLHKPKSRVGGNIISYPAASELRAAGALLGIGEDQMKEIVGRLVADYGSNVRFSSGVDVSGSTITIDYRGSDGTSIQRCFKKQDGKYFAYHSYFRAATTGQGACKALFRTSLGVYKSLGISRIDVYANIDVGGYAWAKYGFKVTQHEWNSMRARFKDRIPSGISAAGRVRLLTVLNDPNPLANFVLSDFMDGEVNIGKKFLLGMNWHGTLDLKDAFLSRRCMTYITPRE